MIEPENKKSFLSLLLQATADPHDTYQFSFKPLELRVLLFQLADSETQLRVLQHHVPLLGCVLSRGLLENEWQSFKYFPYMSHFYPFIVTM